MTSLLKIQRSGAKPVMLKSNPCGVSEWFGQVRIGFPKPTLDKSHAEMCWQGSTAGTLFIGLKNAGQIRAKPTESRQLTWELVGMSSPVAHSR